MDQVHSDYSDSYLQSDADVINTLTSHGGHAYEPTDAEYVIHTHTVPLASTVDMNYLKTEAVKSLFHGYEAGNEGIECPKRSCMYIHRNGTRGHESIPENCPCRKVPGRNDEALKPRCFLTYVRSLGRLLVSESEEIEYIDPKRIMFCQTHTGLFDNKYPGWFRDHIRVTGWQHVREDRLVSSLHSLYWYRKYYQVLNLDKLLSSNLVKLGFRQVRHAIVQSIHTINGVLIKKFMAFCSESIRYSDYAKQTAYMFRDLVSDYLRPLCYSQGRLVEPEGSTYQELKDFLNVVKQSFHKNTLELRREWLDLPIRSKSLRRMLNERERLKSFIEVRAAMGQDYTESPAWIFRCTTLCQTRVLGYLPQSIAEVKRRQFRENVSRPLEIPPKENLELIQLAVADELRRAKIPAGFMEERNDPLAKRRFNQALSAIELPLKGSASVDHFVREGGKIEDARQLINLAIDYKWKIPVRDLHDHEVKATFTVDRLDEGSPAEFVRPLFWLSYTIILNHFVDKGYYPRALYYPLVMDHWSLYKPDPMLASIVHISEPGKERNLTKSSGVLAWFLTPASKVTQDTLAELPEHAAGLTAAGHEWRHQKRISSLSDESMFIYDVESGMTRDNIIHSFKDWTESTDFIGKLIGWAHLSALLEYIAFPEGYMNLIAHAIMEPQPVSEVVALRNFDDPELRADPIQWKGEINEGFMMGNPMTKTILHLIHVSERNVIRQILLQEGIDEGPRDRYRGLGDQVRLDRQSTTRNESVVTV